jgi:hypothetical protein
MRILQPTILALTLTMAVSSTAVAGNIGGLRSAGNIAGLRTAGNIGGTRSLGNIGGTRSARSGAQTDVPNTNPSTPRLELESAISGTFGSLIRMLLESGALF